MDFDEVILKRRSIRRYLSIPVEKEKWSAILEAGCLAPSSGNIQNWNFILVQKKSDREKIAMICNDQTWIAQAPLLIVACANLEEGKTHYGPRGIHYSIQNCSAAIQNMLLKATDIGLGSCWVSAFDEERLHIALGIPSEVQPQAVITIGYADETVPTPAIKDPRETISFDTYGKTVHDFSHALRRRHFYKYVDHIEESSKSLVRDLYDKVKKVLKK